MQNNLKVHHVGYMVKNIAESLAEFQMLGFSAQSPGAVYDPGRHCYFLFIDNCGLCVELIQPKDETSPIWNLSKRYKNMPYHICFETPDLEASVTALTAESYVLVQPPAKAPAIGSTARVAFLMNANIGMIELVELGYGQGAYACASSFSLINLNAACQSCLQK